MLTTPEKANINLKKLVQNELSRISTSDFNLHNFQNGIFKYICFLFYLRDKKG